MRKWLQASIFAALSVGAGQVQSVTAGQDSFRNELVKFIAAGDELRAEGSRLNAAQTALTQQGQQLRARSAAIDIRKAALEKRIADYNAAADARNAARSDNTQKCSSLTAPPPAQHQDSGLAAGDSKQPQPGTPAYVRQCDAGIKDINTGTEMLKAEKTALAAEQQALTAAVAAYNQAASSWNNRELDAVSALNAFYKKQQDYIHNANEFMASTRFQDGILATQSDRSCTVQQHAGKPAVQLTAAVGEVLACIQRVHSRMHRK